MPQALRAERNAVIVGREPEPEPEEEPAAEEYDPALRSMTRAA